MSRVDVDELRCSYCGADLSKGDSFQVVMGHSQRVNQDRNTLERSIRIVCGDCKIRELDRVLAPEVEVDEVVQR